MSLFKFLIKIIEEKIIQIKTLFFLLSYNGKIFFYSESKFYQIYFFDFINSLTNKNLEIIYLSSDLEDQIDHRGVKNLYVGKGFFRSLIFAIIKTQILFMTLSDLDNHEIKRNKFVKNYIYIFHAASSIHKSYTISAFDNYDEIFVVSKNQKKELRSMEKLRNLRKKKITDIGYFYLDHIQKNKKHKISNCILIAPSWNYSDDNFSSKYLFKLLQNLFLKTSKNIILRPHPEQLKRDKSLITYINQKFAKKKNFTLDLSSSNFETLSTSEILITDNSAISIEFILGFEKPVIFFDNYLKIHNKSYKNIGNETIEDEIKKKFGYLIKNPDFEKIDFYLNDAISQFQNKQKNIIKFRDENFFNLGKSTEIACNYIHKNYL